MGARVPGSNLKGLSKEDLGWRLGGNPMSRQASLEQGLESSRGWPCRATWLAPAAAGVECWTRRVSKGRLFPREPPGLCVVSMGEEEAGTWHPWLALRRRHDVYWRSEPQFVWGNPSLGIKLDFFTWAIRWKTSPRSRRGLWCVRGWIRKPPPSPLTLSIKKAGIHLFVLSPLRFFQMSQCIPCHHGVSLS